MFGHCKQSESLLKRQIALFITPLNLIEHFLPPFLVYDFSYIINIVILEINLKITHTF